MIRILTLAVLFTTSSIVNAAGETSAKPDPAKGRQIAESVCVACHMADGNSLIPNFPRLAGQGQLYIAKQLAHFKAGRRQDPSMESIIPAVSEEEFQNLGAWFAQQKPAPIADIAADETEIARGQHLWRAGDAAKGIPACAACHGASGQGLPPQYPRLSGQFPAYLDLQLKNFRTATRTTDPESMMRMIAEKLSDKDIKAVSDYAAGLH